MHSSSIHYKAMPVACGTKYLLQFGDVPLSYAQAIDLLACDPDFRTLLSSLLAASDYAAYRWETPPVTFAGSADPFEFVLIDSPLLAPHPEPEAFSPYFSTLPAEVDVLAIENLGKTATLVVPRQLVEAEHYTHLAQFVRCAPQAQIHHLWQCVAATVKAKLSERPLWLSTAGAGVSWLHVRVEGVPKYYSYQPYRKGC